MRALLEAPTASPLLRRSCFLHARSAMDSDGGTGHGSSSSSAAATPSTVSSVSICQKQLFLKIKMLSHYQSHTSFCGEFRVSLESNSSEACTICMPIAKPFFKQTKVKRNCVILLPPAEPPAGFPDQSGGGQLVGLASLAD